MRGDATVDDAEHPAHDIGAAGEQEAQRIRDAQHPLAHRLLGKDLVDQQCSTLRHAPSTTAGTKAAFLAAEGNLVLGMTGVAAYSQKAVLETPALEVVLELLLHIPRQICALRQKLRFECGVVFLDELIEKGSLRAVAHVWRRAAARTGFLASR